MPLGAGEVDREKLGGLSLYALFESRRLEGGIGYIRFTTFISALNDKIRAAVESMHDAPGLIIDLRGNGGGDDEVAIRLASMLFDKPTQLMITRTRKGDTDYYRARPSKNPYLGTVVILIDEGSGSASEQFTAGMQESGRAYVIGKKSEGDDMDADIEKLPTGAYFIYAAGEPRTPKGFVVEGHGVAPDLEVNLTRAGLLRGDDAQLGAALQYIKQKTSKGTH
jgi:carboxyl-terminal processing protease